MAYGFMTKSFLNSTENRAMKKQRVEATAEYKPGAPVEWPCACRCPHRPYPHLRHDAPPIEGRRHG